MTKAATRQEDCEVSRSPRLSESSRGGTSTPARFRRSKNDEDSAFAACRRCSHQRRLIHRSQSSRWCRSVKRLFRAVGESTRSKAFWHSILDDDGDMPYRLGASSGGLQRHQPTAANETCSLLAGRIYLAANREENHQYFDLFLQDRKNRSRLQGDF
jgi:hypothetical protein